MCASPTRPDEIFATRIAAGNADLLLGCDIVVSARFDALAKLDVGRSKAADQHPRDRDRRFHPRSGLAIPGRTA